MKTRNIYIRNSYPHLVLYRFLLLFLILLTAEKVSAQAKIQVVTKTIEKNIDYKRGMILKVNGEKAKIDIKGWDKNYIKLRIKLIAKHPERAVAEAELEYLKFEVKSEISEIVLYNNFNIPRSAESIKSNLKAQYEIWVPENIELNVSNKYGDIYFSNLGAEIKAEIEFGTVHLNNVSGKADIFSKYADIKGNALDLVMKCQASKADISLQEIKGAYNIKSSYGRIDLSLTNNISYLTINSSRSEIIVNTNGFTNYNYGLSALYSEINIPPGGYEKFKKNLSGNKTFNFESGKRKSTITIATSYNPITIK